MGGVGAGQLLQTRPKMDKGKSYFQTRSCMGWDGGGGGKVGKRTSDRCPIGGKNNISAQGG